MKTEGGKKRLDFERILKATSLLTAPMMILYFFISKENTAFIGRSSNSFVQQRKQSKESSSIEPMTHGFPVQKNSEIVGNYQPSKTTSSRTQNQVQIKLAARQVLIREDGTLNFGFHAGSNLIGELQSAIDSRDPSQTVRVVLPYGAKSRDGSSELPRGTLLLGQVNYPGKGEKVFIQFQQVILPEGKSLKIMAQALDPKDYSTGLSGEMQSQAKSRTMSVMGLTALSAFGEVMTEKESMGQYNVEAKASVKNALLAGVSKAAEVESSRLQEQANVPDYVYVEAGAAMIISLTQGLNL